MNRLLPWLLAVLMLVACDRRNQQPLNASKTTDTVILDPAATDPLPPPARQTAEAPVVAPNWNAASAPVGEPLQAPDP